MKIVFKAAFVGLVLLCSAVFAVAQEPKPLPPRQASEFINARPAYCWRNGLTLEDIMLSTPPDETIIVIARVGDRDFKQNINKRRLHNIRTYWAQGLGERSRRKLETIIIAEGESVKGLGQVEFYVSGKLVEVIKAHPNSDLNAADCYAGIDGESLCAEDWQKLFYPCKDDVDKQNQKRKKPLKK